jgi:hypothetical protein
MATEEPESSRLRVQPLENTAFFDIEADEEYVRIEQSLGNQVRYTPSEARDIADAILDAAEATEKR